MKTPQRKNQRHVLSAEALVDAANHGLSIAEVAAKYGVPRHVIQYHRNGKNADPDRPKKRKIPKEEMHLLGTTSDAELGRRWGVGRAAVQAARKRLPQPISAYQPAAAIPL